MQLLDKIHTVFTAALRVSPALHPPERPSPRRADMAGHGRGSGNAGTEEIYTLYCMHVVFMKSGSIPAHRSTAFMFKGTVYTVWIFICICMSLRVFLFAKKMEFLTKGGIHCISQVFPWHFCFMREHSLVELTEHDDSAANIMVHSMYTYMYCCIHST